MVKDPPANVGDTDLFPGGKISPSTTTIEPVHHRACAPQQEKPLEQGVWTPQVESSPCSLQLEKAQAQQQKSVRGNKGPVQPANKGS